MLVDGTKLLSIIVATKIYWGPSRSINIAVLNSLSSHKPRHPCTMRTIFKNARVFTAASPLIHSNNATCLIVNDGLVEYVGTGEDSFVQTAEAQGCDVQDIQGRTIAPGFIDGYASSPNIRHSCLTHLQTYAPPSFWSKSPQNQHRGLQDVG
jgi:hypothetical protein